MAAKSWISYRVEESKQKIKIDKFEIVVHYISEILWDRIRYYLDEEDLKNESEDVRFLAKIYY